MNDDKQVDLAVVRVHVLRWNGKTRGSIVEI